MTELWVCETGGYDPHTLGAWRSYESAVAGVKEIYGPPYVVDWKDAPAGMPWCDEKDATTLVGIFESVPGYACAHTAYFHFSTMHLPDV